MSSKMFVSQVLRGLSRMARRSGSTRRNRSKHACSLAAQLLEDRRVLSITNLGTLPEHDILNADHDDWTSARDTIESGGSATFQFHMETNAGVFFDIDARETGLSETLDSFLLVSSSTGTLVGFNDDGFDFKRFALPTGQGISSPLQAGFTDSLLYLDLDAGDYVVTVQGFNLTAGDFELRVLADSIYASEVPVFSSDPAAADTLFLDFDGHTSSNDIWTTFDKDKDALGDQPVGP